MEQRVFPSGIVKVQVIGGAALEVGHPLTGTSGSASSVYAFAMHPHSSELAGCKCKCGGRSCSGIGGGD